MLTLQIILMRIQLILVALISLSYSIANAQTYKDLVKFTDTSFTTYYSSGCEERATAMSARCERAIEYVNSLVGFKPKMTLLILNPKHWKKYAPNDVYGFPHASKGVLYVASEDNDFWRSFVPPLAQLPTDMQTKIKQAYTTKDGTLSMMAFFDLLALHELGHTFHNQAGLNMQRSWLRELFCNLMLHTYIAENEPGNLSALELFPQMVVSSGSSGFTFTKLQDFETKAGSMDSRNYGWYECRFHVAARKIYDDGGKDVFIKLWNGLKNNPKDMTDDQLVSFLSNIDGELSKVMTE